MNLAPTCTGSFILASAVTFCADDADAARHLNRAFDPLTSVTLQISFTGVTPSIAQVVSVLWSVGDETNRLARWGRRDVRADERDWLNAVFDAFAGLVIHGFNDGRASFPRQCS
jgi:hypothetical protein